MPSPVVHQCSECDTIINIKRKTCGSTCRAARSRRKNRIRKDQRTMNNEQRQASRIVRGETPDVGKELVREELQPLIRDAITQDVLLSIRKLVQLTPRVVEVLTEDLESSDPLRRSRAATLVAKYTFGNPSVAPRPDEDASGLVVNFEMPRPGTEPAAAVTGTAVELRDCATCGKTKPEEQFVGSSDRCYDCQEAIQAKAAQFLEPDES